MDMNRFFKQDIQVRMDYFITCEWFLWKINKDFSNKQSFSVEPFCVWQVRTPTRAEYIYMLPEWKFWECLLHTIPSHCIQVEYWETFIQSSCQIAQFFEEKKSGGGHSHDEPAACACQ